MIVFFWKTFTICFKPWRLYIAPKWGPHFYCTWCFPCSLSLGITNLKGWLLAICKSAASSPLHTLWSTYLLILQFLHSDLIISFPHQEKKKKLRLRGWKTGDYFNTITDIFLFIPQYFVIFLHHKMPSQTLLVVRTQFHSHLWIDSTSHPVMFPKSRPWLSWPLCFLGWEVWSGFQVTFLHVDQAKDLQARQWLYIFCTVSPLSHLTSSN